MDGCRQIMDLVYPYLDGELVETDRCRIHTHLLACLTCQETFDAERSFLHLFRVGISPHPAPITPRQIVEIVERRSSDADPPIIDHSRP